MDVLRTIEMDGAALFALIAAVGFGWQPMPDGSERYEYIVQVDQDLAATLAAGKSIPIVGEVPEGIHPIARVRVVVGEDSLPRERLVTRLKPVVVAAAADASNEQSIIVRGQNAVAPNPYAETGTGWNGGAAGAPAPSSQQLFDNASAAAESAWNQNVAAPAADALNTAGQNLQNQLVAPVQQGLNDAANQFQKSVGQNVQGAAASLGERTKSLVNELAQPLTPQPAQTARGLRQQQASAPLPAVPPPATGAAASTNPYNGAAAPPTSTSNWNQEPPATNPLRAGVDPSTSSQAGGASTEWNNQPPSTGFPASSPLAQPNLGNNGVAGQPLPQQSPPPMASSTTPGMNDWNSATTPAATTPTAAGQPTAGNSGFGGNDPWQGVPDPRTPATGASSPGGALAAEPTAPFGGAGAGGLNAFPTTPPLNSAALGASTPNLSPPNLATPGIDRNMLSQAPGRPLDGTTTPTTGLGGLPAANVSTTGQGSQQTPARPDIFANRPNPATTPTANGQQPKTPPQTNLANASGAANGAGATASGKDNAVVTLVAWVLLFGSAFGNLYLFWSYLDVRQKYRSLVRKTARAVGSRFSAA
jgi:hypothetical protein